ncbi:hypothetical protein ABH909_003527 [Pseudomonas sp. BS3782 TE3695]|uniref:fibronectin type III domain-containing protein n=1 Tax=Pseudomonas sp. BS3782 TE3695 TaxID=3349323 RepID=UPI003D19A216
MNNQEQPATEPEVTYVAIPGAISATARSESSIFVSWAYGAGGGHTGTRLKWETGGAAVGELDIPISLLVHLITGLNPNTQYTIKAFGLKGDEASPGSKDAQATTKPASAVPASPTNLLATPTKDTMALIWAGPANASSYKLSYGLAPNGPVIGNETSTSTAHILHGLSSGTQYYFDVRSTNNVGDSPPTRVTKQTLQVPAAPGGLRATAAVSTLDVEWTASTGAVDYVIRYGVEPAGSATTLTTRLLRQPLTDLIKNTLYFVEVSARNNNGTSSPARITQKTLDGPPLPELPVIGAVQVQHDTVRIVWGAPQYPRYEIAYGIDDADRKVIGTETTTYLNCLIRHLAFSTRYFFEVRALNESGPSEPARTSAAIGPDQTQPRNLSVPGRTFSEARLTWERPLDPSYLRDYEITCPGRPIVHTTALEYIATGLAPETEYVFKVQPRRLESPNPARFESVSVITHDHVPPTCPQALELTPVTSGSATLSWRASQDNVGVAGYVVRRNEGAWVPATGTCHLFNGLIEGEIEIFDVRAKDAAGNLSVPARIVIGANPLLLPSIPRNFRVTAGLVPHLQWDAPAEPADMIGYRIIITGPGGTELPYQSTIGSLKPVLIPNTRYDVRITAYNSQGSSPPLNGVIGQTG